MSQMSEPLSYPLYRLLAQSIMISYPSPTLTNLPKPEQHGSSGCLISHDTSENENMCRFMSSGDGCFQAAGAVQAHAIAATSLWGEKTQNKKTRCSAPHQTSHQSVHIGWENAPQKMQCAANLRSVHCNLLSNVKCWLKAFWKESREKEVRSTLLKWWTRERKPSLDLPEGHIETGFYSCSLPYSPI